VGEPVYYAAFSPDGTRLVTCSADQAARIWDTATGTQIGRAIDHSSKNRLEAHISAAFSPDSALLVSCGGNGFVRITTTTNGEPYKLEPIHHETPLTVVRFSPNGERFAVAGQDGSFWIHDCRTGTQLISRRGHQGSITSLSFSPDGRNVVTCAEDSTAQIWDAQNGKPIGARLHHEHSILTAEFSPDGQWVVTCSY